MGTEKHSEKLGVIKNDKVKLSCQIRCTNQ